jgi:hypothetical protein
VSNELSVRNRYIHEAAIPSASSAQDAVPRNDTNFVVLVSYVDKPARQTCGILCMLRCSAEAQGRAPVQLVCGMSCHKKSVDQFQIRDLIAAANFAQMSNPGSVRFRTAGDFSDLCDPPSPHLPPTTAKAAAGSWRR